MSLQSVKPLRNEKIQPFPGEIPEIQPSVMSLVATLGNLMEMMHYWGTTCTESLALLQIPKVMQQSDMSRTNISGNLPFVMSQREHKHHLYHLQATYHIQMTWKATRKYQVEGS